MSGSQLWQLAIVADGQIVTNELDLTLNDVIIIDEPFGCRCHTALAGGGARDGLEVCTQYPRVLSSAREHRSPMARGFDDAMVACQRLGKLLETLHAHEFSTDRPRFGSLGGEAEIEPPARSRLLQRDL